MKIVKVHCADTAYNSIDTWSKEGLATFKPVTADIVGWLVEEREDCIIIAKEVYSDGDFRHVSAILRVNILSIAELNEADSESIFPDK